MMKKLLTICCLLIVLCPLVGAQGVTVTASALQVQTPSGACQAGRVRVTTAGIIYTCVSGTWTALTTSSGTVTSVSVTTANGVSGSVATATTTPAITLTLGAITPSSVATSGTIVQTSANAAAFESGPNGSTNPVFRLVNSTASSATGLSITGNAAGGGVALTALSSGSNETIGIFPKGTGVVGIGTLTAINVGGSILPVFTQPAKLSVLGNFAANNNANGSDHMLITNDANINTLALWNQSSTGFSAVRFLRSTGEEQAAIGVTTVTPWGDSDGSLYIEFGDVFSPTVYGKLRMIQGRLNPPSPLLRQLWDSDGSITTYDQSGGAVLTLSASGRATFTPSEAAGNAVYIKQRSVTGFSTIVSQNSGGSDTLVVGSANASASVFPGLSYLLTVSQDFLLATYNGVSVAEKWRLKVAGDLVTGTDNAFDIGASGATRPRTGYFATSLYAESNSGVIGLGASRDVLLTRRAAAGLNLGAADAASPVAQTLSVQSVVAGTADTAGAATTVIGSLSTGSGTSGDIVFKTGGTGAGSTSQNTATTALTIKGATQVVQVASTTDATSTTTGALTVAGGMSVLKRVWFAALSAASGTPNTACLNAATHELVENAALTCTVSAREFKTNIADMKTPALSLLNQLRPKSFAYKDFPNRLRWGFIADEVQAVDRKLGDGYNAAGDAKAIDLAAILALTVKAMQEQQQQIDALKQEVKQLKGGR